MAVEVFGPSVGVLPAAPLSPRAPPRKCIGCGVPEAGGSRGGSPTAYAMNSRMCWRNNITFDDNDAAAAGDDEEEEHSSDEGASFVDKEAGGLPEAMPEDETGSTDEEEAAGSDAPNGYEAQLPAVEHEKLDQARDSHGGDTAPEVQNGVEAKVAADEAESVVSPCDAIHTELERLTDALSCTVCFDPPELCTRILQCRNGHILCNTCYDGVQRAARSQKLTQGVCPSCRVALDRKPIRVLALEQVVSALPVKCPHGCAAHGITRGKLRAHEAFCPVIIGRDADEWEREAAAAHGDVAETLTVCSKAVASLREEVVATKEEVETGRAEMFLEKMNLDQKVTQLRADGSLVEAERYLARAHSALNRKKQTVERETERERQLDERMTLISAAFVVAESEAQCLAAAVSEVSDAASGLRNSMTGSQESVLQARERVTKAREDLKLAPKARNVIRDLHRIIHCVEDPEAELRTPSHDDSQDPELSEESPMEALATDEPQPEAASEHDEDEYQLETAAEAVEERIPDIPRRRSFQRTANSVRDVWWMEFFCCFGAGAQAS